VTRQILDKLRDTVDRGDSWRPHDDPEHPNPLAGVALEWSSGRTKDGTRECDILVVRDDEDKVWSVWTWHAALRAQIVGDKDNAVPVERRPVQAGDFLAIRWIGKFPRQDGDGETHRYRTAIERPAVGEGSKLATDDGAFLDSLERYGQALVENPEPLAPAAANDDIPF